MVRLRDKKWRMRVPRTLELETCAKVASRLEYTDDIGPHRNVLIISIRVPDNIHAVLGARDRRTLTLLDVLRKPLVLRVASDEGYYDDLGFFALEVVHRCHSDSLEKSSFADRGSR
jgi:hypothetical protein